MALQVLESPPERAKEQEESDDEKARSDLLELVETEAANEIKRVYGATLRAEVGEMAELLELPEAAIRKLQVAARGAASKSVDRHRGSIKATVKRMMERRMNEVNVDLRSVTFNGKPINVVAADVGPHTGQQREEEQEQKAPKERLGINVSRRGTYFYFTVRYQRGSSSTSIGPRDSQLRDEDVWKKTTTAVLKPAQLTKHAEYRQEKMKAALVQMMLATMQFELHLRDNQLDGVRKELNKRITMNSSLVSSGFENAVRNCRTQLKPDHFFEVLSGPQRDLWASAQAYYLRYK